MTVTVFGYIPLSRVCYKVDLWQQGEPIKLGFVLVKHTLLH